MSERVLEVSGLCKSYPGFALQDVSFSLKRGEIMGLIGRNGAGKTTTLKSMLRLVQPDAGEIRYFGMDLFERELEIKERIAFVSGGAHYYPAKRLRSILQVTRSFFPGWDEELCVKYMEQFKLDERKQLRQLSEGMKVKFALVPALSRGAEILILDEPTSGLDPVSREELLEIFMELADTGVSILFSTHIISDLEKCADSITYIQNGSVRLSCSRKELTESYRLVQLPERMEDERLLGQRRGKDGYSALLRAEDAAHFDRPVRAATLEEIMLHLEKEAEA